MLYHIVTLNMIFFIHTTHILNSLEQKNEDVARVEARHPHFALYSKRRQPPGPAFTRPSLFWDDWGWFQTCAYKEYKNHGQIIATSRRPHWKSWLVRGIIPKWPQFRLVKYYNLPRNHGKNLIFPRGKLGTGAHRHRSNAWLHPADPRRHAQSIGGPEPSAPRWWWIWSRLF
jgi:hypothetical protein